MDNQHRQIKGYRELTQAEIDAMNLIKDVAAKVGEITELVKKTPGADQRWLAIGITDLQKGFMALTRSIAKPTTF